MQKLAVLGFIISMFSCGFAWATPSTLIWTPSNDIKAFKVFHIDADNYTPLRSRDRNGNKLYVQQVYGFETGLLSGNPETNVLGRIWEPLSRVMAEAGFDYKKGWGSTLDTWPWYFNFKIGVPEDAYFKYMPAFAIGIYDAGIKRNQTNYNVWYFRFGRTFSLGRFSLGRLSAGYFNGNSKLLLDKNGQRDNAGLMVAWDRAMPEISDRLWLCVDYQGTQSSYGALNVGFSWKFTDNISTLIGYDVYNNPNSINTVTFQLDIDF